MQDLGFDFSLHARNADLVKSGMTPHAFRKTGTTIAGCIFDGGVILGADTRATGGSTVMVKDCHKIHYLADNIWCCGAGTAADTDHVTEMASANLRLFTMNTGIQPRVEQAASILINKLFPYGGYISAALILGGVDFTGPSVYSISPDGCLAKGPFMTMGSGMYASISVMEQRWRPNMTEADAKELVADAIEAGITQDLGSGSNVNLCVITQKGHEYLANYRVTNERPFKMAEPVHGFTIEVLKETTKKLTQQEAHLDVLDGTT